MKELSGAKASLNIMAWHKDGFTERIANSMLCKSLVITDRSTCLEKQYRDGEELLLFDLTDLRSLPERVRDHLTNDRKREQILENAYTRAVAEDTWRTRAELFLAYCRELA